MKRKDKVSKRMERLDDLMLSVIDETLKQIFREVGTMLIYDYLENNCHLKREEIAEKPEVFSADLRKLLKSGAAVLEKMILKNLYSELQLKYEEKEGYEFLDYTKELKEKCGCQSMKSYARMENIER
jgi:hypothetical protein